VLSGDCSFGGESRVRTWPPLSWSDMPDERPAAYRRGSSGTSLQRIHPPGSSFMYESNLYRPTEVGPPPGSSFESHILELRSGRNVEGRDHPDFGAVLHFEQFTSAFGRVPPNDKFVEHRGRKSCPCRSSVPG
jgi:hypothetical protein